MPFLEHESLGAPERQLASQFGQGTRRLFHGVANKDQGADAGRGGLVSGMIENTSDLGQSAGNLNRAHEPCKAGSAGDEGRGPALGRAPIINKLHRQAAQRRCRFEHPALQADGQIPGGLAACRGIERKDQAPASL